MGRTTTPIEEYKRIRLLWAADIVSPYAAAVSAASLKTVLGLSDSTWNQVWDWCEGLCADIANFENDPEKTERGERAKLAPTPRDRSARYGGHVLSFGSGVRL